MHQSFLPKNQLEFRAELRLALTGLFVTKASNANLFLHPGLADPLGVTSAAASYIPFRKREALICWIRHFPSTPPTTTVFLETTFTERSKQTYNFYYSFKFLQLFKQNTMNLTSFSHIYHYFQTDFSFILMNWSVFLASLVFEGYISWPCTTWKLHLFVRKFQIELCE